MQKSNQISLALFDNIKRNDFGKFRLGKSVTKAELLKNKYVVMAIYSENNLVGFCELKLMLDANTYEEYVYISHFRIFPEYRDRGLGSELIEAVNYFLDNLGLEGRLDNEIFKMNFNESGNSFKIGLYKRHGWTDAPTELHWDRMKRGIQK